MPKIVVEGPDGKKYAFPDTMPREEINAFMKQRYGTKARNETVQDYLARVVREQDATKARAKEVTEKAGVAGAESRAAAAKRMGIDTPFEMAIGANALAMAERAGSGRVYEQEGTILSDEAAGLSAINAAGLFIPSMVNQRFSDRMTEARRQNPGAGFVGDLAGGMIGGELIGFGLQKVGQAVAPAVSQIGRLFKGKPAAAAPEPPMVLGPESRILPVDRPDALPGDDVAMAKALDAWTPPVEQQVRPMGLFGGKKPPTERTIEEVARDIKGIEKQLRRKGYTLNEAETMVEDGTLPAELRGLMIQHGDLVRESGRLQGATARTSKSVLNNPQYQRLESELNKASDDIANAEYEIANELRQMGYQWDGDDAEFMGIIDTLKREGKLSNYLSSRVEDLRAASTRFFDTESKMKEIAKGGLLTERGRDAVKQTFGAAYMSGTGSVAGGQYDLNGDGQIDNTDLAIGSGIGLAAFASPLALRKVAELGGRLKGTKAQGMAPNPPETPQQAARYETPGSPEYEAAIAKGLDMSTPARMARAKEMGFDTETVLYHGTTRDFDQFDLNAQPNMGNVSERAVFLTPDPESATDFAMISGSLDGQAGPRVMPLVVRGKIKQLTPEDLPELRRPGKSGQLVYRTEPFARIIEQAKREGFAGVKVPNVYDVNRAADQVIIFDPANIRSVHAAFDPDKAASPILTAGLGGKR